ncbi:MAG: sigma-54-dependent Fis family transcriptional regulator [Pirellulales bacterium]|nr:sigma-54-dependent Fis family transcriptional regulator [Pirellulales bacterium]
MCPLIFKSMAMMEVARRIERASQTDSPVMVFGEPGTGKKQVAESIHRQNRRGDGPLVIFSTENMAARLLEEKLFGNSEKPSVLETTGSGTLLIDEITRLPRTVQARLLEAADARHRADMKYSGDRAIDFRLMATTRYDLRESVARGVLREDIGYRLAVVSIQVPPLRGRREDIPSLVRHILEELSVAHGRCVPSVSSKLMRLLMRHAWPGNVSQLRIYLDTMLYETGGDILDEQNFRVPFL